MNNILVDLHSHSNCSPDGSHSVADMYERACELGLKVYAITDHCECNFWESAPSDNVTDARMYGAGEYSKKSINEQTKFKDKYDAKTKILIGMELGQCMQNIEKAEEIANDNRLDFIIGSLHMVKGHDDFYYLDYNKMSADETDKLLTAYFDEIESMCRWGKFDVLGHLTYPLRYITGKYGINIDMSRYEEAIRCIFKTLISNGKGIEINTSGLRQECGFSFPTIEYVKMFKELGGEIITIGSDSHCTQDIGKGIKEGIEIAKQAGFERIAYFVKHEPMFFEI